MGAGKDEGVGSGEPGRSTDRGSVEGSQRWTRGSWGPNPSPMGWRAGEVSLPSVPWVGSLSWTSEVAASLARRGVSVPLSPPLSVSLGRAGLLPTGPQVKLGRVGSTWVRGFIASEWRFAFFCKTEAFLVFYFKSVFKLQAHNLHSFASTVLL